MTLLPPTLEFLRGLWRLNHALERRSSHMLTHLGITAQQRMVMRCIGCLPGTSAGQLAEVLHLDPGTLSATLRRLEDRGLIRRARDRDDSRRIIVSLTARGKLLDVPTAHTVEAAAERLLAETPPERVAALAGDLARFAALLEESSESSP